MKKIIIFMAFCAMAGAEINPRTFGAAFENYLTGNYEKAFKDSSRLYKDNPSEKRVSELHHKTLVKMALLEESRGNYKAAVEHITKAGKINLTGEVKEIRQRLLKRIGGAKKNAKKRVPAKKIKRTPRPVKKKPAVSKPKKPVKKIKKDKTVRKIIKPDKPARMRYPTSVFVLLVINLMAIMGLGYFVAAAFSKKKESKLMEEERRISQIVHTLGSKGEYQTILQNQKEVMDALAKLPEETSMMKLQNAEVIKLIERLTKSKTGTNIELSSHSSRAGIAGVDDTARVRADTVELLAEMFKTSPIMEELLGPYLNDPNNRVRGNAAIALFPRNRRRALDNVSEMGKADDVWMRMTAAWVCGEMGVSEGVKIMTPLLNDSSFHVRKRALASFKKLKDAGVEISIEIEQKMQDIEAEDKEN
ncbi:MAG: HEAT repeat domain-containing protein [Elusimicrobiota bacterium]|nr:HEAT repeat domain-containing protein [Elusimicrobiota bacterium]